ncbi:MAG: YceI family protein [Candidatus Promineifilaceae bacterium]|nr:YceI family protein [Candidatus Promineifilaceae bacterium]
MNYWNEFITFTPVGINDLPDAAGIGEEVAFTVDGNLTIRDVTQPETFNVVAAAVSDTELRGTAAATISREAYGLRITRVPLVANVEKEVELTIDFVAHAG